MFEIVAEIVENGHAEELREIIEQCRLDVSKRKENEENERI